MNVPKIKNLAESRVITWWIEFEGKDYIYTEHYSGEDWLAHEVELIGYDEIDWEEQQKLAGIFIETIKEYKKNN
ncbi:MAG: hypothetical protein EBU90_27390 [Proteobacteria bacterium]|nr:hypothetical protein [Pseudomonadota bacterium]